MTRIKAKLPRLTAALFLVACGASEGSPKPAPVQNVGGTSNVGGAPGVAGAGQGSSGEASIAGRPAASGGAPEQPASQAGSSGAGFAGTAAGGSAGSSGSAGNATAGGGASAGSAGASSGGGGPGAPISSLGCGKGPTLKNNGYNSLTSAGQNRQFYLRLPSGYDNTRPYRLIFGLHGAGGKGTDVAPGFFGLYELSNGSTVFVAPDAAGGLWSTAADTAFVDAILEAVEADVCIDTTRVELEGFSQGAAMAWNLACSRPKVFRAVVGHSGGGVANPTTCQPIPYLGSLGLSDIGGNSQKTQTDQFAKWNGCTIETLPTAPSGGHVCTDYKGCPAGYPVRWCSYDGGHTPSPSDAGKNTSWMPSEVWPFFAQF